MHEALYITGKGDWYGSKNASVKRNSWKEKKRQFLVDLNEVKKEGE